MYKHNYKLQILNQYYHSPPIFFFSELPGAKDRWRRPSTPDRRTSHLHHEHEAGPRFEAAVHLGQKTGNLHRLLTLQPLSPEHFRFPWSRKRKHQREQRFGFRRRHFLKQNISKLLQLVFLCYVLKFTIYTCNFSGIFTSWRLSVVAMKGIRMHARASSTLFPQFSLAPQPLRRRQFFYRPQVSAERSKVIMDRD